MKTVCAWCQTVMRDGPRPVSHGICAACEVNAIADIFNPNGSAGLVEGSERNQSQYAMENSNRGRWDTLPGLAARPAIDNAGAVQCRTGPSGVVTSSNGDHCVGQLLQANQVQPRTFNTLREALIAADLRHPCWWHLVATDSGWLLSWSANYTTT